MQWSLLHFFFFCIYMCFKQPIIHCSSNSKVFCFKLHFKCGKSCVYHNKLTTVFLLDSFHFPIVITRCIKLFTYGKLIWNTWCDLFRYTIYEYLIWIPVLWEVRQTVIHSFLGNSEANACEFLENTSHYTFTFLTLIIGYLTQLGSFNKLFLGSIHLI